MSEQSEPAADEGVRTGYYFAKVIRSPVALGGLALTLFLVALVGVAEAGTGVALAGAAVVVLLWLLIVGVVAGQQAKKAFFSAYAAKRGLRMADDQGLPGSTPLLRMGDERKADELLSGNLPGGLEGSIALYTYEEKNRGADGQQTTEYHHFTLVLANLPESRARVPALYCQRRFGFRFLDGAEDVFRENKRIELESERLDSRCEIFAAPASDDNWMRQLFSPTFVAFLAEDTPGGFAFEVENGMLCVNIKNHAKKASDLDRLCKDATTVATRLREEIAE
jgi:hypothetical protein